MDDPARLWTRPGDYVMLRYRDEHNRDPGHPTNRESFLLVADDEAADFVMPDMGIVAPQSLEQSSEPTYWTLTLRDPDQALPGLDRLEMQALSFATKDKVRFDALLGDLDGTFSAGVPVTIAPKPEVQLPPDADPNLPRRIYTRTDRYYQQGRASGRDSRGRDPFSIPLAVAGDDIVWLGCDDKTPTSAAGRLFVRVANERLLNELSAVSGQQVALPDEARTEGVPVLLKDPAVALDDTRKARSRGVLEEIARKKRNLKHLLASYQAALEGIGARIDALTPKKAEPAPPAEAEPAPPAKLKEADAPLTTEEEKGGAQVGEELLETDELVAVAALKRDRDGLSQSMLLVKGRLDDLAKYATDELEAAIDKAEAEAVAVAHERARNAEAERKGAETPAPQPKPEQVPPAWYEQADWWKNCGVLVPGTTLKVRVADPDIQGDTATVLVVPMGVGRPRIIEVAAKAVAGQPGVFEALIPTSADRPPETPPAEGPLALSGVRAVALTYRDTFQQKFPASRAAYLSLASDAALKITGHDFLEEKTRYHLGEDIYVSVQDADMDKTDERDYVWAEVTSDVGDREMLPLRESQPHSGVFRGSIPTQLKEPGGPLGRSSEAKLLQGPRQGTQPQDGALSGKFAGALSVRYVDELWLRKGPEDQAPPDLKADASFVEGTDGTVEIFARQLKRSALQRDVLFSTALAQYELGRSSTEIGALERGRGQLLKSREEFRALLEQYPDDPVCAHATYYMGNIQFLLGDYDAAVQSLQRVIDRWPKSDFQAKALYKLGTCHLKAGDLSRAVESFVNLAYHHSDDPLVAESMLALAQHFNKQRNYPPAISVCRAFIQKFPDHERTGNVYLRTAGWLIVEKRLKEAVELLEQAEKQRPDDEKNMPAFLYWHADCLFKTSGPRSLDYKKGINLLQRVTYDYPDSRWAKYAEARLAELDVGQ